MQRKIPLRKKKRRRSKQSRNKCTYWTRCHKWNLFEEKEEEVNKEETNALIVLDVVNESLKEEEQLDVKAEDANKGKWTLPKLTEEAWTLVVQQPVRAVKTIKKKAAKNKKKGKWTLVPKKPERAGESKGLQLIRIKTRIRRKETQELEAHESTITQ